jgi:hypothetical protein
MPHECLFGTRNATIGATCECSPMVHVCFHSVQLLILTLATVMPPSEHNQPLSSCLARRMDPPWQPTASTSQLSSKRHPNIVAACPPQSQAHPIPPATLRTRSARVLALFRRVLRHPIPLQPRPAVCGLVFRAEPNNLIQHTTAAHP